MLRHVHLVLLGIDEFAAVGVEAKIGKDVAHLIVQDIKDELTVVRIHIVLFFLVYRTEGLCAGTLGIGGEGITEYADADFAVPIFCKGAIQLAATCFVGCLKQFQVAILGVNIHRVRTL